jgi:hypothetical protein
VDEDVDIKSFITQFLDQLASLDLERVEWLTLGPQGSGILFAFYFHSRRGQIYLTEWSHFFSLVFKIEMGADQLRDNSKYVKIIIMRAQQEDSLKVHCLQVILF